MATAYRAEMFAEVFGDGSQFGLEVEYVHETTPLGTGGGIRNAAASLRSGPEDPIVVLNGDILSGHDLGAQLDLHRKADAAVTLHLVEVPDPSRFGCVPTDFDGRVTAFLEKTPNPVTSQINAGCYIFTRRFIDAMPAGQVLSVERDTFPDLIKADETVMGYLESAYWLDVGTPEAYVRGSADLVLGELASPAVPGDCRPGAAAARRARRIRRPSCAAARSPEQAPSSGQSATVDGSVLFDGVTIGAGAKVTASVVGSGATDRRRRRTRRRGDRHRRRRGRRQRIAARPAGLAGRPAGQHRDQVLHRCLAVVGSAARRDRPGAAAAVGGGVPDRCPVGAWRAPPGLRRSSFRPGRLRGDLARLPHSRWPGNAAHRLAGRPEPGHVWWTAPPGDQAAAGCSTGCRPCSAPRTGQRSSCPQHPVLREAVRRRTGIQDRQVRPRARSAGAGRARAEGRRQGSLAGLAAPAAAIRRARARACAGRPASAARAEPPGPRSRPGSGTRPASRRSGPGRSRPRPG